MSHPTTTANGCTLEDCHTNLFALTDLAGIKWRKLAPKTTFYGDPLEDPVLLAFTKCISSDILCVWRRVAKTDKRPQDQLNVGKELWIFWYGDEPANLKNMIGIDLEEQDRGCWDNGLSYECRTLLFKALHNLIERCLLSQNFVRMGKWFVQPYSHQQTTHGSRSADKSAHLSIRFSFFLHGESTVCASIDVRQHPPLRTLHTQHLSIASQSSHSAVHVILAPYGLSGTLTGVVYKDSEPATQQLMDEWRQFYILPDWEGGESRMAPVVEVLVAGVRMRYPSNFVLVTAETEAELLRQHGSMVNSGAQGQAPQPNCPNTSNNPSVLPYSPPTSPGPGQEAGTPIKSMPSVKWTVEPSIDLEGSTTVASRLVEKVWQDCAITSGVQQHRLQQGESGSPDEATLIGTWDFGEPMQKNTCGCPKAKGVKQRSGGSSQSKPSSGNQSKHSKGEKGEKGEKDKSRHGRGVFSFHRRAFMEDDMLPAELDYIIQRVPPPQGTFANFKTPAGGSGPVSAMSGSGQSVGAPYDGAVDSPHSAAPSPLVASQIPPSVSHQNGDPTMPTLSPHPPSKNTEKDLNSSGGLPNESQDLVNGVGVMGPVLPPGTADPLGKPALPLGVVKSETTYHTAMTASLDSSKAENVNKWLESQQGRQAETLNLKRPHLPCKNYEDDSEELVTESLYDFTTLNAWLVHPVKRQRMLDPEAPFKRNVPSVGPAGSSFHSRAGRDRSPSPELEHDPYEFSDESSNATTLVRSFPRPASISRQDEEFGRRSTDKDDMKPVTNGGSPMSPSTGVRENDISANLMREKDLRPSINDLEKLFDTSDSENSEPDPVFPQTSPPGGSRPSEDQTRLAPLTKSLPQGPCTGPTPPELARMFPTPPSHETANSGLSPGQAMELPPEHTILEPAHPHSAQLEVQHHFIQEEPYTTKDWSYVYKPPTIAMFVGSPKYTSIELPSQKMEPLPVGPQHCYKPSIQQYIPIIEKHPLPPQSHYTNIPSIENVNSVSRSQPERMTSVEASPATFGPNSQQRTPRTPLSYELQSPASNASSYLNKNISSIDNNPTNSQIPEINALVVNNILADSILNLFRDHNFDSCTICVCNMNIKGSDVGLYLPDKTMEAQYRCTCGFSAVVNRKLGANSGLFYEDEVEITGIRNERLEERKPSLFELEESSKEKALLPEVVPQDILLLLQGQFSSLFPSCTILQHYTQKHLDPLPPNSDPLNHLEIQDGCEACYAALEIARQAADNVPATKLEDAVLKATCLHKWPYLQNTAKIPKNSEEVVRVLKSLQPLLQDAIQKKRTTRLWESVYTISGPLSWKDFHLLAGRGSEETSEPQPVTSVLVGYDKEWLSISPHSIRYWDKLMLEPYGRQRDVVYIVVAPDNDYILGNVRPFFQELSRVYEQCRLGRHRSMTKLRDGVMRVGKTTGQKVMDEVVGEWFKLIGNNPVASKLRMYAQVCIHLLVPLLKTSESEIKTIFEQPSSSKGAIPLRQPAESPQPSSNSQNVDSQGSQQNSQPDDRSGESGDGQKENMGGPDMEPDSGETAEAPAIVFYMVDPFSYGNDWQPITRLAMLGILRCFREMLEGLPEHLQQNTQLQIIPQQAILDFRESSSSQYMKNLCMSVYTQSRRLVTHSILGRSLTGFGPAASAEKILKPKDSTHIGGVRLYSPPFVIAPSKELPINLDLADTTERSSTLLCCYCLSEDQRWLIASCIEEHGELLETCNINIEIPNRNRRKKVSARKIGLGKLWDFLLGVMSSTATPWRLIIGRFGRLGHGELKGWSGLLSRKNLARAGKQLREMCNMCSILGGCNVPSIQSACLVSMESHQSIHIMTDSVKMEEKRSSNCKLSTPRDASCTHILVFPTSSTAQASQAMNPEDHRIDITGPDENLAEELFKSEDWGQIEGMGEMDLFGFLDTESGVEEKNNSAPGSPNNGGRHSPTLNSGRGGEASNASDAQDEMCNLLQQPLAMGFYVSTAKTGPLPKWFWAASPQRQDLCPSCFKAALHIHTVDRQDDLGVGQASNPKLLHPLDSNLTCDVLRYVLETYNTLSWLTIDPTTNDRRSCLPAHIVVLMQLYHALDAFV